MRCFAGNWTVEARPLPAVSVFVMRCPSAVTRRLQPAGYGPRPLRWRNGFALRAAGRLVLVAREVTR